MQRFKEIHHPPSLLRSVTQDPSGSSICSARIDLPVRPQPLDSSSPPSVFGTPEAFLVDGVLSEEEAEWYIQEAERVGMESLEGVFPKEFRSNHRLITLSHPAAQALFNRLRPSFTDLDNLMEPMGVGSSGIWIPCGLNECLKIGRYQSGCHFSPHIDGPWVPDDHTASILTVVIYLNGPDSSRNSFEGGETNFLHQQQQQPQQQHAQHVSLIERSVKQPKSVQCSVVPKTGRALLFRHDLLHEGAPIREGMKYILRTEVLFRRIQSALRPPLELSTVSPDDVEQYNRVIDLYRKSEESYDNKQSKEFVEEYLEALEIQKSQSDKSSSRLFFILPPRVMLAVLSWLSSIEDLVNMMKVNKALYKMGRSSGALWRRWVHPSWPQQTLQGDHQQDWYKTISTRKSEKKKNESPKKEKDWGVKGEKSENSYSSYRFTPTHLPSSVYLGDIGKEGDGYPPAVVIDNGSLNIKAGFAGEENPRKIAPTIVGRPRHMGSHNLSYAPSGIREWYCGEEAQSKRGIFTISYPVEHGIVTNWDAMEHIWEDTFKQLEVVSKERPLLFTETIRNPRANREKTIQIMMEYLETPLAYLALQPALALHSTGVETGFVIESGDAVTMVTPIYQGHVLQYAATSVDYGGRDLTHYLMKLLNDGRGYNFTTSAELEMVRDIKDKHAFISLNPEADLRISQYNSAPSQFIMKDINSTLFSRLPNELLYQIENVVKKHDMMIKYPLPGAGSEPITLVAERFQCAEALFNPTLMGLEFPGIHEMLRDSLLMVDPDLHASLLSNIIISGGNCMFPGLKARLGKELKSCLPGQYQSSFKIVEAKQNAVWKGGAMLAASPWFTENGLTQQVYDEYGPCIVHRLFY